MTDQGADDLSPKEIASMRWQAIEGFNSAPGLSPLARRLGIALICTMDPKTRNCFPGEVRLATELGVHLSAIKKAKAELRDAELITWFNPGGPRHLSRYMFGWAALLRLAKEAGERANLTVRKGRKGTQQGTNAQPLNSTRGGTNPATVTVTAEPVTATEQPVTPPINGTQIGFQGTQIEAQGTLQGTAIVPTRGPDITQDRTELDRAEHHHDEVGGAPSRRVTATDAPSHKIGNTDRAAIEEALEIGRRVQVAQPKPRRFACIMPSLMTAFADDDETLEAVEFLNPDRQPTACGLLATQGRDAARAFILKHSANEP